MIRRTDAVLRAGFAALLLNPTTSVPQLLPTAHKQLVEKKQNLAIVSKKITITNIAKIVNDVQYLSLTSDWQWPVNGCVIVSVITLECSAQRRLVPAISVTSV